MSKQLKEKKVYLYLDTKEQENNPKKSVKYISEETRDLKKINI